MLIYEQSERIYATIPRSVYEVLVEKANANVRSLSSQIAYALTMYYKEDVQRVRAAHEDKQKETRGLT